MRKVSHAGPAVESGSDTDRDQERVSQYVFVGLASDSTTTRQHEGLVWPAIRASSFEIHGHDQR